MYGAHDFQEDLWITDEIRQGDRLDEIIVEDGDLFALTAPDVDVGGGCD